MLPLLANKDEYCIVFIMYFYRSVVNKIC